MLQGLLPSKSWPPPSALAGLTKVGIAPAEEQVPVGHVACLGLRNQSVRLERHRLHQKLAADTAVVDTTS
jgi:hypothetical protein